MLQGSCLQFCWSSPRRFFRLPGSSGDLPKITGGTCTRRGSPAGEPAPGIRERDPEADQRAEQGAAQRTTGALPSRSRGTFSLTRSTPPDGRRRPGASRGATMKRPWRECGGRVSSSSTTSSHIPGAGNAPARPTRSGPIPGTRPCCRKWASTW